MARVRLAGRAAPTGGPNEIARVRAELTAAGIALTDLSDSNPTRHGLLRPEVLDVVAEATRRCERYRPVPRGPLAAREALADYYGGDPDDYWLTASTSEAYSWLLTILADPGEAVAVPVPGYPLVEPLARLSGVRTVDYPLHYLHPYGWTPDPAVLADRVAEPTLRAVIVVNPGNPTGAYVSGSRSSGGSKDRGDSASSEGSGSSSGSSDPGGSEDSGSSSGSGGLAGSEGSGDSSGSKTSEGLGGSGDSANTGDSANYDGSAMVDACRDAGVALVADEVFGPFALDGQPTTFGGESSVVTFTLGGLSKLLCAPQLKLGWIRLSGPPSDTAAGREALDTVADTFLSVGAPVAAALPELLTLAGDSVAATRERLAGNLATARAIFGDGPYRVRRCEGGWTVIVDVPRYLPAEQLVVHLLRSAHLAVHPGWFYDLPDQGALALSLLPEPEAFADGLRRLRAAVEDLAG